MTTSEGGLWYEDQLFDRSTISLGHAGFGDVAGTPECSPPHVSCRRWKLCASSIFFPSLDSLVLYLVLVSGLVVVVLSDTRYNLPDLHDVGLNYLI